MKGLNFGNLDSEFCLSLCCPKTKLVDQTWVVRKLINANPEIDIKLIPTSVVFGFMPISFQTIQHRDQEKHLGGCKPPKHTLVNSK